MFFVHIFLLSLQNKRATINNKNKAYVQAIHIICDILLSNQI